MLIGTHNGQFHCDEVSSCAIMLIKHILECYTDDSKDIRNFKIIRSRNIEELNKCEYVFDVGGIYDPLINRYDHHMITFKEKFKYCNSEKYNIDDNDNNNNNNDNSDSNISYMSSFGLAWTHFGKEVIKLLLNDMKILESSVNIDFIYNSFYKNFVYPIDCVDNGVFNNYNNNNYTPFELHRIVSGYNLSADKLKSDDQNIQFNYAVDLMKIIIQNSIKSYIILSYNYMLNLNHFLNVYNNKDYLYENNRILYLDKEYNIQKYLNIYDKEQKIQLIIVKRNDNEFLMWTTRDKKQNNDINNNKLNIPLLTYDEACKFDNIIFIHKNLFTGSCKTFESALNICIHSIYKQDNINTNLNDNINTNNMNNMNNINDMNDIDSKISRYISYIFYIPKCVYGYIFYIPKCVYGYFSSKNKKE